MSKIRFFMLMYGCNNLVKYFPKTFVKKNEKFCQNFCEATDKGFPYTNFKCKRDN